MQKERQFTGFKNGLKQTSIQLDLALSNIPRNIDWKEVDLWLKEYIEIEILPYQGFNTTKTDLVTQDIATLSWRIMHVASSLLQAIRIPSFDPGYITTIVPGNNTTDTYKIRVLATIINHMPFNIMTNAYNVAINILLEFINRPSRDITTISDTLSTYIQTQFIQPAQQYIPSGKSTIPMLKAAYHNNIPFIHLGSGIYRLGWGKHAKLIDRSGIELDSAIGAGISQDKQLTSRILKMAGLPSPVNFSVYNIHEAMHAAHQLSFPVVIKPADKDRGEGVTVNILNDNMVQKAFHYAARYSKNILVEKQIPGVCHRLVVANNKFKYAIKRNPKSIVGDGVHTISELIDITNHKNNTQKKIIYKQTKPIVLDEAALEAIKLAQYNINTIPAKNQLVALRKTESAEGVYVENITDKVHPDNIAIAIEATQCLKLNVAGIDIISPDISVPWHVNGAAINEVNFTPHWTGSTDASAHGLSDFLTDIFDKQGRIPIEIFVGNHLAFEQALKRQQELIGQNIMCHLTTHTQSYNTLGETKLLIEFDDSLFLRCQALLMNQQVEAIILVVHTDEFIHTGLPVDCIHHINIINNDVMSWGQSTQKINATTHHALMELLYVYQAKN